MVGKQGLGREWVWGPGEQSPSPSGGLLWLLINRLAKVTSPQVLGR